MIINVIRAEMLNLACSWGKTSLPIISANATADIQLAVSCLFIPAAFCNKYVHCTQQELEIKCLTLGFGRSCCIISWFYWNVQQKLKKFTIWNGRGISFGKDFMRLFNFVAIEVASVLFKMILAVTCSFIVYFAIAFQLHTIINSNQ